MKKINLLLLCTVAISMALTSCKKDNDDECPVPCDTTGTDTTTQYANYSQLKVGNYWVYEIFNVDSNGASSTTNTFDSCYISGDTVINGIKYYIRNGQNLLSTTMGVYRDSLHYIVSATGEIIFSSLNFTAVFNSYYITAGATDTVAFVSSQMADANFSVITPAGVFTTVNYQTTYNMYPGWQSSGNPRKRNTRYAANIGIVTETLQFFSSNPNYQEKRLIRYHLN